MTARIVGFCSRHAALVIAAALIVALIGDAARRRLPRDVVPDLSDPRIVLLATWMGHSATEVATNVTDVVGNALEELPGVSAVRGSSMSGMGFVEVVFESPSSLEPGRRAIVERVASLRRSLAPEVRVDVGPLASSTGWVFMYALVDRGHVQSPLALRAFQDGVLRPALSKIPGVAEVASLGGGAEQLAIEVNPSALRDGGAAFSDVVTTIRGALASKPPSSIEAISKLSVAGRSGGAPLALGDVARVRVAHEMTNGLADIEGVHPAVGGIVVAQRTADPTAVVADVRKALTDLRSRVPTGVEVVSVYDRSELTARVGKTLLVALTEEIGVVVLVILVFLLHGRSALVPFATLPVVLLLTFAGMWLFGVPATVMSLGGIGIALGMAVDAEVVALEACHRRLASSGERLGEKERRQALMAAAGSFAPAILTSLLIAALTFLPVFAFTGESARLLRPLALTKTLVILAAGLVVLTLGPALRVALLRGRIKREEENPLMRRLIRMYRPFVHFALTRPTLTLVTAFLAVLSTVPIASRLGAEFLPRIDEGDLLFMPSTIAGVDPADAAWEMRRQDRLIKKFGEVSTVFGKVGRAETATDPAPYSMIETTVRLKPRSEWPTVLRTRWYSSWAPDFLRGPLQTLWPEKTPATTDELIERLDDATRLPGWASAWTAPIRARMDMMSTGVRTPVGIRIVASDPARLDALAETLRTLAERLPGTRSAVLESLGGEARPRFTFDDAALAEFDVDPALARTTADFVIAGGEVGKLVLDGRQLRVRVLPEPTASRATDVLRDISVRAKDRGLGQAVPLALVGHPDFETTPASVRTERGRLVAYVFVDLQGGTDPKSFVERAKLEVERARNSGNFKLGPNERIEWTGQYELLAEGEARLRWIVPTVLLSMLALLFLQFRSLVEALIVMSSVPFALVGSFWTLHLLGYPMSAPVWVGLLSVVGLAMQTGVVMVVYIDAAFHARVREGRLRTRNDIVAAHAEGTVGRLRPKIMTIATMGAGLLPLLWTDGAGAEVMKRVAAPMLGGLVTSAFLTLEVLPVLYTIWRHRQLRRAEHLGVPIAKIVGNAPAWAGGRGGS